MILDMFNIDEFIKLNGCKEVTNPIFWQPNKLPTDDGLFSYEIFGYSEEERKNIFGYIDLKGYYINPVVYSIISSRMSNIRDIIIGEKYAIVDGNRKIKTVPEDTPHAETGLDFIYNNFDKIKWIDELEESEIDSIDKKTRLKFLQLLKKEEFFVSKWLVLPPFYREEQADSRSLGDVINQTYKELISACRSMKMSFDFDIFGNATRTRIQNTLLKLYNITMGPITGKSLNTKTNEFVGNSKNSLLKRSLIGKTIDYGAYTVIVAPVISDTKSMDKTVVPFGYAGITLISVLGAFHPFIVHEAYKIINDDILTTIYNNYNTNIKLSVSQISMNDIEKMMSRFIKSGEERFDEFSIDIKDRQTNEEMVVCPNIYEFTSEADAKNNRNAHIRRLTYADIFMMAAQKAVKNKHVLITRHPVTNIKNIYPARVLINSTAKTREVYLKLDLDSDDYFYYDRYPFIYTNQETIEMLLDAYKDDDRISSDKNYFRIRPSSYYEFVGTTILGNGVIKAMGADYDGDTVFIRGVYSIQANEEADKLTFSKSNLVGPNGEVIRGLTQIGKDCVVTLYEFTKD